MCSLSRNVQNHMSEDDCSRAWVHSATAFSMAVTDGIFAIFSYFFLACFTAKWKLLLASLCLPIRMHWEQQQGSESSCALGQAGRTGRSE